MRFSLGEGFGWFGSGIGLILLMMVVTLAFGVLHYRNVEKPERDQDFADEGEAERRRREAEDQVPL